MYNQIVMMTKMWIVLTVAIVAFLQLAKLLRRNLLGHSQSFKTKSPQTISALVRLAELNRA